MYLQPQTKQGKLPVIHILCIEKKGVKNELPKNLKVQVQGLE